LTLQGTASQSQRGLPATPDLGDGLTPVDIWQSLHASQRAWLSRTPEDERRPFAAFAEGSDRQLMEMLADFPAKRWAYLCNGAGWSPIALAAYSWCRDAVLEDMLAGWESLGKDGSISPGSVAERAARFVNPARLPENRLSALLKIVTSENGLAVLIRARPDAPQRDIPASHLDRLTPATLKMLAVTRV
jgi:hypothetical protein